MSKILIFPWPELGHVLPTLSVTRYLVSKGHEVNYLTAHQFAPQVTSVGGTIEPLFPGNVDPTTLCGSSLWYRFALDYGRDSRAIQLHNLIRKVIERGNYCLILCDYIFGRGWYRFFHKLVGDRKLVSFSTTLFDWNGPKEWGFPTIVFCPEAFELDNFRNKQSAVIYTEPSLPPIGAEDDLSNIALSNSPLVLVSFGTQSIRYRQMAELLSVINEIARRQPQLQFVVATGRSKEHAQTWESTMPNNVIVRQYIPQRSLLRRASAMVTHGGCGSIKEAVCAGVPLVVLPMLSDQPFNAMRVRYHGLGDAVFPNKQSTQSIECVICDAVDGRFTARLKPMQSAFVAMEKEQISRRVVDECLISSMDK